MNVTIPELTSYKDPTNEETYEAWMAVKNASTDEEFDKKAGDFVELTQSLLAYTVVNTCNRRRIHCAEDIYNYSLLKAFEGVKRLIRGSRPMDIPGPPASNPYVVRIYFDVVRFAIRSKFRDRDKQDVAMVPAEVAKEYYHNLAVTNPYSWRAYHARNFLAELPIVLEKFLLKKSRFSHAWNPAIEYCSRRYCEGKIPALSIVRGAYKVDLPQFLSDWCKVWLRFYLKSKGVLESQDQSFEYNVIYPEGPGDVSIPDEYEL